MALNIADLDGELQKVWNPTFLPSPETPLPPNTKPADYVVVNTALEKIRVLIRNEIRLDGTVSATLATLCTKIQNSVENSLDSARNISQATPKSKWLVAQLEKLDSQLKDLSLLDDPSPENARALYAGAGQWAIHFSVVRMTVAIFLVGLSWGVVSVKWTEPSTPLYWAAIVVWLLSLILFITLTIFTHMWGVRQSQSRQILQPGKEAKHPAIMQKVLWDKPLWVYLAATVCFFILLQFWQANKDAAFPAKVVLGTYENSTRKFIPWPDITNLIHNSTGTVPDDSQLTNLVNARTRELSEQISNLFVSRISDLQRDFSNKFDSMANFQNTISNRLDTLSNMVSKLETNAPSPALNPTPPGNQSFYISNAVFQVDHATINSEERPMTNSANKSQKTMILNVLGLQFNRTNTISN